MAHPSRGFTGPASLLAALAFPATAWAFDPIGHDLIEATAYRRLAQTDQQVPDGIGGYVPGTTVLAALISDGVLDAPACFGPATDTPACQEARVHDPVSWWPPLRSGRMDYVMDRHFGTVGQCYHFLAHIEDDTGPLDPSTGIPMGLRDASYRRCMRLVGTLVEVAAGAGAGDARGLDNEAYALLHAVMDSFAPAHVERDDQGRIRWLRTWINLPWRDAGDIRRHHRFRDPRDMDYLRPERRSDPRCDMHRRHPYSVPDDCLSDVGTRASRAVADVLVLVYQMRRRAQAWGEPPVLTGEHNRECWDQLVSRHLRHAHLRVDGRGLAPYELDAWPRVALGLGADIDGANAHPGVHLGVMAPLFLLGRDRFLPFAPNASAEVGVVPGEGIRLAADVAFSLPVTPWLWLGAAPFRLDVIAYTNSPRVDAFVGFMVPRLDLFQTSGSHRGLWVRLSGPGAYDLVTARWQWQAAVTVGLHLDTGLDAQPDPMEPELRPLQDTSVTGSRRPWAPPWFTGEALSPFAPQTYLYAGFGGRTGGGVDGGVELLRSLADGWHVLDLGGALEVSGPGGGLGAGTEIDAVIRVRPVSFLAFHLVPVGAGVMFAGGANASADWTLVSRVGMAILLGPLRISAGLPPLDLRHFRVATELGVDLRFSVDLAGVLQWRGTAVSLEPEGGRGVLPSP